LKLNQSLSEIVLLGLLPKYKVRQKLKNKRWYDCMDWKLREIGRKRGKGEKREREREKEGQRAREGERGKGKRRERGKGKEKRKWKKKGKWKEKRGVERIQI